MKEILASYEAVIQNTKKALHLAGMPSRMIPLYVAHIPPFTDMLPTDVLQLYKQMREAVIRYLFSIGFSQREIVRRVGTGSYALINAILRERTASVPIGTIEEVMKNENKSSIIDESPSEEDD